MAYIIYTDEPYKRDFYHHVLKAHFEGYGIVVDKGFEWKEEEGSIKYISILFPINPYWYELGNKPDYLSSRKIYWYRARMTYWLEGPEITIYGEWVQFTSINPMCTGFTNFEAKRIMRTYYSYHGIIMKCPKRAEPEPFVCEPEAPTGPFWVLEYEYYFQCAYQYCYHSFDMNANWLPSTDPDPCDKKWSPPTKRYYWVWLYLVPRYPFCAASFSQGTICYYSAFDFKYGPFTWSLGDWVWADSTLIAKTFNAAAGSHIKVWRSETGEKPGYDPTE